MNFDFLNTQQGLNISLANNSLKIGEENFATKKASNDSPRNNDEFSKFLKTQDQKSQARESSKANKSERNETSVNKTDAFHTKEASQTVIISDDLLSSLENANLNQDTITLLSDEILRLIDQNLENQDTLEQTIIATAVDEQKDIKSILALIASVLIGTEDGNIQTKTEAIDVNSQIPDILKHVEAMLQSDEAFGIISGLTPAELTDIQNQLRMFIKEQLDQEEIDALQAIAAQFVSLNPPRGNARANETQSRITPITLETVVKDNQHHAQSRYDDRYDVRFDRSPSLTSDTVKEARNFKSAMNDAKGVATNQTQAQPATSTPADAPIFMQNAFGTIDPALAPSAAALQTAAPTVQSSLTNAITQSHYAGQQHPATQAVSITMQKAMKAGEPTNIKLQLSPPELGRVEVKMSIDKDNKTKIVLTVEKPETYLLLQRDADGLERALSDAGLSADGDIDFELASDNHNFDGHDEKQNAKNGGENNKLNNDDEFIETAMDWQVDPQTGRMHYNILV